MTIGAHKNNFVLFLKSVKPRIICGRKKLFRVRDPVRDLRYLDWCSGLQFFLGVDKLVCGQRRCCNISVG
jgi:hypothetical protein